MNSFFKPHLELAHRYWAETLCPGDSAIDATCGNGHDTLFISGLKPGKLYAIDKQKKALDSARLALENQSAPILYYEQCHSLFPEEIHEGSVKLIVYNLGYLPGADKDLTTKADTTLESLSHALKLVMERGLISLTCYPGHPEGQREETALLDYAASLDPSMWNCCFHRWINRNRSPSLLIIKRG